MIDWQHFPTALSDRCVMCAQCLPHCPTWRLARIEAESPRGRIALMRALASGVIAPEAPSLRHLDQCLDCRQCEAVCPAHVPYGALHDAAQHALGGPRRPRGLIRRLLHRWVKRAAPFGGFAGTLIRAWANTRARRPVTAILPRRLRELDALLPDHALPAPLTGVHGDGESVNLFLGCIARAVDGETLDAAVAALRRCGFSVRIPADQGCCGALHQHAGDVSSARELAARNVRAFDGDAPVVTCASGCAATLLDYPGLVAAGGERFSARVVDIMTFLAARGAGARNTGTGTAIHTPCTLHAVQRAESPPSALLTGARHVPYRGRCCGAAGEYLLAQPRLATALRDEVLDEIGEADTVCTSNPGCAMHLRAGLRARGRDTLVHHPVVEWLRCH